MGSKKSSRKKTTPPREVLESGGSGKAAGVLAWVGFSAILAACIAYVLFHAFLIDSVTQRLVRELDGPDARPAEVLPVPLLEIAFDGYVWNRHAEELFEDGEWRVRHTLMDNAPEGREVHWSSGFAWYLRALGELHRHFSGDTLRNSIFRMSIWANPILLVLALGLFATLSARRFGPLCGSVLAIGMISTASFYEGFLPAYPDHHGITGFALLGLVFGIAWAGAGWVQQPGGDAFLPARSLRQARHGMVFSGVSAAAALWISGFSAAVLAFGIGLGAMLGVVLFARKAAEEGCEYHAELWKLWALVTAGGSLFFYMLEYFPNHLGMRLEVNHPLYALSWLGGGWVVYEMTWWLRDLRLAPRPFPWKRLILPVLMAVSLPAVILGTGSEFYTIRHDFMLGLMKNIAEVLPLLTRIEMGAISWQVAFGYFPLLLLAAVVMLFLPRMCSAAKGAFLVMACPIFVVTALQVLQVRWGMLNGPTYIALAGIVIPQMWRLVPRRPIARVVAGLVLCGVAVLFTQGTVRGMVLPFWRQHTSGQKVEVGSGQLLALLHRDIAKKILENANGKPVVLLSSPNSSCLLSNFGGFRTIGTLYWENVEGLQTAAHMLNAQSDQEALRMLQERGVTHLSFMTWENFIGPYFQIIHPKPKPGVSLENSFGQKALFKKQIPIWARPIPYPPNFMTQALKQDVLLIEVVPGQTRDEAEFHLARFERISRNNPVAAEILLKGILERVPEASVVRMELADLFLSQKRYGEATRQIVRAMKDSEPRTRRQIAEQAAQRLEREGAISEAGEVREALGEP